MASETGASVQTENEALLLEAVFRLDYAEIERLRPIVLFERLSPSDRARWAAALTAATVAARELEAVQNELCAGGAHLVGAMQRILRGET